MEQKFCHSCGIPLDGTIAKESGLANHCEWCVDPATNKLKPREEVQKGIAEWLKMFTPKEGNPDLMKRADHYIKAMPAWAEE
jgi:hypothetical protein